MKRVLCVLLILALSVPVLLVSASATEEYVFTWVNPEAVVLDDYEMVVGSDYCFFYDGSISDGYYTACMLFEDDGDVFRFVFSDPFYVVFPTDMDTEYSISAFAECYENDTLVESGAFDLKFGKLGSVVICGLLLNGTLVNLDESMTFVLTSYSVVPSLSDYVSSDLFLGFMDEIIAILPVCVVAIVGYIGTRKGIAWVRDQLYGA